jgi:hypothetical protein
LQRGKVAAFDKASRLFQIGQMVLREVLHLNKSPRPSPGSIGTVKLKHPTRAAISADGVFHRLIFFDR